MNYLNVTPVRTENGQKFVPYGWPIHRRAKPPAWLSKSGALEPPGQTQRRTPGLDISILYHAPGALSLFGLKLRVLSKPAFLRFQDFTDQWN